MRRVDSMAKRLKGWLVGTHAGAVSQAQLSYYLDEFTFRFNARRKTPGKLFERLLKQAVTAGEDKYDETAVAMIALLKYGTGVPFKRLERLQEQLEMPLPATTQWDLMAAAAKLIRPVLEELIRQAAQGSVMHNGLSWDVLAGRELFLNQLKISLKLRVWLNFCRYHFRQC
jgi:hypothetical protein